VVTVILSDLCSAEKLCHIQNTLSLFISDDMLKNWIPSARDYRPVVEASHWLRG